MSHEGKLIKLKSQKEKLNKPHCFDIKILEQENL